MGNALETMTVTELRDRAKECGISGRWDMTKTQLIEALTVEVLPCTEDEVEQSETTLETDTEDVKEVIDAECKEIDDVECETVEAKVVDKFEPVAIETLKATQSKATRIRMRKLESIQQGEFVAFVVDDKNVCNKRVMTAKVINRSASRKMLQVETKRGSVIVVPFEDVLWIRTGKVWPAEIYSLLKGGSMNYERDTE